MNKIIDKIVLQHSPGMLATCISKRKWKMPAHLSLLNDALTLCSKEKLKRLLVNMPPRHGKSELISKYFPFWYLLNHPEKRVLLCSYSASFADSWGRKVRDLINEYGSICGIEISKSSRAAGNFLLAGHSGGMSCAGAGGPITGKGADLLIIDDPVKNDTQAHSPLIRKKQWEWLKATAMTRLEPGAATVIVMTRWHEDDICGRLLQSEKIVFNIESVSEDNWLCLRLPALATNGDLLGRKPGEPLWRERFPIEELLKIKKSIGEYWFSALYQQTPNPAGGGIFKKQFFKYFSENQDYYLIKDGKFTQIKKDTCLIAAVMDLAISASETADYTVILVFAQTVCGKTLVLDVLRERFETSEHLSLVERTFNQFKPSIIGIESVQYQTALVQAVMHKGFPVMKLKPDRDKISRSLPMAARMDAGEVYFLQAASWIADFESELLAFPNGKHDDQVDAFAYIAAILNPISSINPVGIPRSGILKEKLSQGFRD